MVEKRSGMRDGYAYMLKEFQKRNFCTVATFACLFAVTSAGADIVTLTPVEDATISEFSLDTAFGSVNTIISGADGPEQFALRNRALLKFNLVPNIPGNAVVTSANLTLTLVKTPRPDSLWFSLHKVLLDWNESAVTWTSRLLPPATWNAPGGVAPLDFSSSTTQSNLIIATTVPANFTFASNPAMVADLQDWVRNPTNNFGWILVCESEDVERTKRFFASSEYTTNSVPTNRPVLEVQFTLPHPPLTLTLLPQTSGQFQFLFNAESNRDYTVEHCSDLIAKNWVILTNIAALPFSADVIVSDAFVTVSNRFYRVRTP